MLVQAILVAISVFICVGGAELAGLTMLNRPIVIGSVVGLLLGDLNTGILIGASLEAVFMGVVNIGGAQAAEPGIATAVGVAFAIMVGGGAKVALTLAIPIGILGLQIKNLLYIFLVGFFAPVF
jgi:Phosphotransferase system, mannose/fructose/N-acetylgalactosamine-specific component IIC